MITGKEALDRHLAALRALPLLEQCRLIEGPETPDGIEPREVVDARIKKVEGPWFILKDPEPIDLEGLERSRIEWESRGISSGREFGPGPNWKAILEAARKRMRDTYRRNEALGKVINYFPHCRPPVVGRKLLERRDGYIEEEQIVAGRFPRSGSIQIGRTGLWETVSRRWVPAGEKQGS